MAKAFIDDTHLTDIADAIRATLDESRQYLPSEMANAIQSMPVMAQLNSKKYFQSVPTGAASGYATIEQVEGNTVVWNQQFVNPNFSQNSDWGTYQATIGSVADNILTFTSTTVSGQINQRISYIAGHKYYVSIEAKSSSTANFRLSICATYQDAKPLSSDWQKWESIGEAANDGEYFSSFNVRSANVTVNVRNARHIDLTAIFGAGNEPTTVADFEAWLSQNIGTLPYYDYNAGELLSVKIQSVKSVGFNQWDEEWEVGTINTSTGENVPSNVTIRSKNYIACFPSSNYYRKAGYNLYILYYDDRKQYLGSSVSTPYGLNNIFTTPMNACYMRFIPYQYGTTYNHDICINISDPAKNGTYEPYHSDLADIDVTTITGINTSTNVRETIFPNGMKQADRAGTVKDTLDLLGDTATVNVGSRAYQSGDESDTSVITDGTTTYYALTTPITYTDLQDGNGNPLNPRYKVEQGGTEQVLPANTSTPTTVAPTLSTIYKKA